ncbi:hypothetical protein FJTKL_10471 [Diaporthe vaccinii]|uniref:Uncharacterized protein n=1 Tax=Diaporthe vaccinii TaxID=105482 RepID=A0ABR4EJJ6_9PEZI
MQFCTFKFVKLPHNTSIRQSRCLRSQPKPVTERVQQGRQESAHFSPPHLPRPAADLPPSISGSPPPLPVWFRLRNSEENPDGAGTMSGLNPMRMTEPAQATAADSRNPDFDRSIRYHRNGLTMASVMETCIVDAQGTFL